MPGSAAFRTESEVRLARASRVKATNRVLVALLLRALALHFTGIASEIGGLYFGDEGKYRAQARRILGGAPLGGTRAAVIGSLALVLSPIYLETCHQNIADVPSAFFAALCFAHLAGLAIRESARGYACLLYT